ncbi:flagellar biosynthesis regulator FlaF [Pseudoroseomonas cervicalis]|uniref:flagellar biosynthesis regulator FlaF n=1 Tax=Teichococcus cervicalis TaxID=204525 RepID=UPI002780551C|nr:flagellar biosynthesis regulator FlaF [Pseudoroseomonas cervicalis]MDQ1080050.1 flagellar biosynthesis regulator FlaF [Pseudoroseomonas cervicalis]
MSHSSALALIEPAMPATGCVAPESGGARALEAAAFRQVNAALRAAGEDRLAREAAQAQARRLWQAVLVAIAAPESTLPLPLRQGLLSLGAAMLRELGRNRPDLDFILGINEQIAAGLGPQH